MRVENSVPVQVDVHPQLVLLLGEARHQALVQPLLQLVLHQLLLLLLLLVLGDHGPQLGRKGGLTGEEQFWGILRKFIYFFFIQ